jgi:hypothetical protein
MKRRKYLIKLEIDPNEDGKDFLNYLERNRFIKLRKDWSRRTDQVFWQGIGTNGPHRCCVRISCEGKSLSLLKLMFPTLEIENFVELNDAK